MTEHIEHKVKGKVEKYIKAFFKVVIGGILLIALVMLFAYITMRLWNWLMPQIFGLIIIDYWQALGIIVLAKILFGGLGGHSSKNKKTNFKKNFKTRYEKRGCKGFDNWKYYDQFWEEEGNQAFEDFIKREKGGSTQENRS